MLRVIWHERNVLKQVIYLGTVLSSFYFIWYSKKSICGFSDIFNVEAQGGDLKDETSESFFQSAERKVGV